MDRNRHLTTLELNKVLEILSDIAALSDSKELARNLTPSYDFKEISRRLEETDEAYVLTAKFGAPSFGFLTNVKSALKMADAGGCCSLKQLLDIAENLRIARTVKSWRSHCECVALPELDQIFEAVIPNKYLEEKIRTAIKSEEELFDEASPELSRIRRAIKSEGLNIKDRLDKMIKSSTFTKYLQDAIVTQRDGRYVVPVKIEHRSNVPGLVHDTSASGATVFVEPMSVVETNNKLKVLYAKEKDEIERILYELSAEAATFADSIGVSYDALVNLSFIFAKAELAFRQRAVKPKLNQKGIIKLKNARHPLISPKTVVPISLELGNEFDTLVITGPNTGGKTVTIKTIGLFTLMAMCGLFIPADDGSEIAVFENVLADIGDEQSIEQSLSTFSAHMKNIIDILNVNNGNSLVLCDELGAGTDPVEGAALATAVLMELRKTGCRIAATSHYNELKMYALETEGVCNASCEFDVASLKPTYKLNVGAPGSSNAFAVSGRLGLSNEVIEAAKSLISRENTRFERVVSQLEKERVELEKEREAAEKLRMSLLEQKKKYDVNLKEAHKQKEKIIEKARDTASNIVERARSESNRMLDELDKIKKDSEAVVADRIQKARKAAADGLRKLEDISDPIETKKAENYKLPRKLKTGDEVLIVSLDKKAFVVSTNDKSNTVEVQAGIIKTRVNIKDLRLLEEKSKSTAPKFPSKRNVSGIKSNTERSVSMDFDMRGMNCDEGIMELDRYIDNALLTGVNSVCIIHGKGTGVLRKAVHDFLRHDNRIKSFRLGVFGEGEAGVTITELK